MHVVDNVLCTACLARGRISSCIRVQCTSRDVVYFCENNKCIYFFVPCPPGEISGQHKGHVIDPHVSAYKRCCSEPENTRILQTDVDLDLFSMCKSDQQQDSGFTSAAASVACEQLGVSPSSTQPDEGMLSVPGCSVQAPCGSVATVLTPLPQTVPRSSLKGLVTYSHYRRSVLSRARRNADLLRLNVIHGRPRGSSTASDLNFMRSSLLSAGVRLSSKSTKSS
ncbi:hypothetical protein CRM22_008028 [Opisthorchis felineus]|uniref:Uncharacterized protein n=1 Tax=Opisthorchis felineus TaxID=147828 RepID=A0A4S2LDJ7_OPIFE|nr:hypothetical protein CRM22_008028 [Opisthorchis felineus]